MSVSAERIRASDGEHSMIPTKKAVKPWQMPSGCLKPDLSWRLPHSLKLTFVLGTRDILKLYCFPDTINTTVDNTKKAAEEAKEKAKQAAEAAKEEAKRVASKYPT